MTAGGKADDKDVVRIDMEFLRVVTDIFHCGGSVDKGIRPYGIARAVYGITENERVEARREVSVCDGVRFSVGAKGIRAAGNDEDRLSFFVERKLRGRTGDI